MAQLAKRMKKRTQVNRIRNEQGKTTVDSEEILNLSGYFKIPLRKVGNLWMIVYTYPAIRDQQLE